MAAHKLATGSSSKDGPSNSFFVSNIGGKGKQVHRVEPSSTIAQFSFAPATQTTVVTTTTTTTTKFPPLLLRPPKHAADFDAKLYPLATTPTPASLKSISFVIDGKRSNFYEAENPTVAMREFQNEHNSLEDADGLIRRVQSFASSIDSNFQQVQHSAGVAGRDSKPRLASPDSITEQEEVEGSRKLRRHHSRVLSSTDRTRVQQDETDLLRRHTAIQNLAPQKPLTPVTDEWDRRRCGQHIITANRIGLNRDHPEQALPSPTTGHQKTRLVASYIQSPSQSLHQHDRTSAGSVDTRRSADRDLISGVRGEQDCVVPTPPVDPGDWQLNSRPPSRRNAPFVPSRLSFVDNSTVQDGSLPSPSLSPITAAANIQNAGYFADIDSGSELASQHDHDIFEHGMSVTDTPSRSRFQSPVAAEAAKSYATLPTGSSMTDIPAMFDFFEAIPDEFKSYVMYQLLRRCPKPTLKIVAEAVNPALKCDFLTAPPIEVGLNILKFLDLRSLCNAAQVSKKWRNLVNGAEDIWKQLLDADGFILPEGELQQSIVEGWAWQDPSGSSGYEQNVSVSGNSRSESDGIISSPAESSKGQRKTPTGAPRRSKRKAATTLSNRNKQAKRKDTRRGVPTDVEAIDCRTLFSSAEGPYNAASEAAKAVPEPKGGLPSLRSLHLYKSLYRRHYLIRRNWMFEDTKPHHIAFRAHDRHVVTCLQFDTDKILTGSDDNNINVYDTKTGQLRVKLQGHEGGVWALQYEGNTLVSGSTDRSVRVWNIEQGLETQVFRGHTSTVRCLQIVSPVKIGENADGKAIMMPRYPLIVTGSRDSTLRIWRLPLPGDPPYIQPENATDDDDCPYFVRSLSGHSHSVRAIAAHADTLVSGSYDSSVRVWKISTGAEVHRLQGHTAKVYSVVLDCARNRCISGSMDNMVKIWSLDTGSALFTLDGHTSLVGLLDLNCERLVSAAADSTLRIWDPENGQCKTTLTAHTGAITCFQHDAQKVISGSDRTLKMWNVKTGECIKDLLSDLSGVWQVKFNERRCVAAVQRDNMTYIEVLDFGAARDGIPESRRGRRIVVDEGGAEVSPVIDDSGYLDLDGNADGDE